MSFKVHLHVLVVYGLPSCNLQQEMNVYTICCNLCVLISNDLFCNEVADQDVHNLHATTWQSFIIALNWILLDLSVEIKYHFYQQSMLCWWVPYIHNIHKNSTNRKKSQNSKILKKYMYTIYFKYVGPCGNGTYQPM